MTPDPEIDPCGTCGRDAQLGYGGDLCGVGHALCRDHVFSACGECEAGE